MRMQNSGNNSHLQLDPVTKTKPRGARLSRQSAIEGLQTIHNLYNSGYLDSQVSDTQYFDLGPWEDLGHASDRDDEGLGDLVGCCEGTIVPVDDIDRREGHNMGSGAARGSELSLTAVPTIPAYIPGRTYTAAMALEVTPTNVPKPASAIAPASLSLSIRVEKSSTAQLCFRKLKRRCLPAHPTKAYPGTYNVYWELLQKHGDDANSLTTEELIEQSRLEYIRRLYAKEAPVPTEGLEYTFKSEDLSKTSACGLPHVHCRDSKAQ